MFSMNLCVADSTHPTPLKYLPKLKQAGATGITLDARYGPVSCMLMIALHNHPMVHNFGPKYGSSILPVLLPILTQVIGSHFRGKQLWDLKSDKGSELVSELYQYVIWFHPPARFEDSVA
jgi:hypothetical protein